MHLRCVPILAALALLAACKRAPQAGSAPATPRPGRVAEKVFAASAPTPVPAPPAAPASAAPEAPEPPPRLPAQVIADYVAAGDPARRVEIIYDATERAADGLALLAQLFPLETDVALKDAILTVADTFDEEQEIEARLALLRLALRADQPQEIRDSAIGMLLLVADPRAAAVWRDLLGDRDPTVREFAEQQIAELSAQ